MSTFKYGQALFERIKSSATANALRLRDNSAVFLKKLEKRRNCSTPSCERRPQNNDQCSTIHSADFIWAGKVLLSKIEPPDELVNGLSLEKAMNELDIVLNLSQISSEERLRKIEELLFNEYTLRKSVLAERKINRIIRGDVNDQDLLQRCQKLLKRDLRNERKKGVNILSLDGGGMKKTANGLAGLLTDQSYYDTTAFENALRSIVGEERELLNTGLNKGPHVLLGMENLTIEKPFLSKGKIFMDGGLVANNPTVVALCESQSVYRNAKMNCVISIGNGRSVHSQSLSKVERGLERFLTDSLYAIISSATNTDNVHQCLKMSQISKEGRYIRLNPRLDKHYSMTESRPEKWLEMKDGVDRWFNMGGSYGGRDLLAKIKDMLC
ncbi:hypothetical protein ACOME3_003664 [Neoechinorhynchus agilis]